MTRMELACHYLFNACLNDMKEVRYGYVQRNTCQLSQVPFAASGDSPVCFVCYHAEGVSRLHHEGSIIEVSGDEIYLCIGTKDGAAVGQELTVYKVASKPRSQKDPSPSFTREHTGKVRITEVLDEHFARAVIISGKADANSIVELTKP
jgi:hypothetical protein